MADCGLIVDCGLGIRDAIAGLQSTIQNPQSSAIRNPQSAMTALEYLMPLFEYECRGCGKQFEFLVRGSETPACPGCHGVDLQKLLSVFAAQSDSPAKSFKSMPQAPCGSCGDPRGPGACSVN